MKCPKCQFENPEDSMFCLECGEKMELKCPECSKVLPIGAKFCNKCGHDLRRPEEAPPKDLSFEEKLTKIQKYLPKGLTEKILSQKDRIEGERKQVTVMFCDMEGFTQLSERLGPEEAYVIMDQVYEILIHKVHDYEGTVNEFTGDGIMALFGAPIALEDAPQRAIRSAHAIHREMTKFSDKQRQEKEKIPLIKMRIGIHTGPVVVGTLGNDLRVEFKAVGDTVNLASRMQGLAEPGATYMSEETFRLTEGLFRVEALGELEVKGKEKAVKTYRVIAPSSRRTRFDVSAERGLTPFIGRERELELLLDGFERSKEGKGQAFSIMAEAGIGKSRLLYEFRKAISNEAVTFLEGKCLSYSGNVAYHPIVDVLKANFDVQDGDGDFEIREKVKKGLKILEADEASTLPYLLELLSVKDSGIDKISMSPEKKKDRITEAVKGITIKGSEIRPLIIAIEDLHWVDKSSEEYLKVQLDSILGARVFLLFTYRPEFVHTWGGRSYHNQVNLNRLSNRESFLMVSHLLGTEHIDRDIEELILKKAEGVPFFIEEFIRSLKDLKIIKRRANTYQLTKDIQTVTIPSTIQDVIMARIDSLPEIAKGVLQTGAVVGRELGYDLIKIVTGLPESELLSHLSVLKDSELLYERGIYPQSTYVFKHALTQEVAYNSFLLKRRKKIHEKIGNAIEDIYVDRLEEFSETLAYHYSKSDDLEKAHQYLKLSGEKATRNCSLWEAFRFYKEAISVLNRMPETGENKGKQIEVLHLMTIPMRLLGYPEDSLQSLKEGEKLSKELRHERSLSIFYGNLGHYYSLKGDSLLGIKYAGKCFEEAQAIQDIELIAPAAVDLCVSAAFVGEFEKIIDVAPKVLDLLERTQRESEFFGRPFIIYPTLCTYYGSSIAALGNFEEGKVQCERGLRFAIESNHLANLGYAELHYATLFMLKGDGENTVRHAKNCIRYTEEGKFVAILGPAWLSLGVGYYLLGDLEVARNHIEEGLKIHSNAGLSYLLSSFFVQLSTVHLEAGDLKNAQSCAEKAVELSQKNNEKYQEGRSWALLGRILGKTEPPQSEKAEEYILKGIKILDELKIKPFCSVGYLYLGELYTYTGKREKALENLKKTESMFQEMGMDYWLTRTQEVLARL